MRYCFFISLLAAALTSSAQNVWTQKADLAAGPRTAAVGFSIGTGGYIGTGYDSTSFRRNFYVYNQASNIWMQVQSLGGSTGSGLSRNLASAFVIGTKAYICCGQGGSPFLNDTWEYDAGSDVWTQKANFAGTARRAAAAFAIGTKGYIGTGQDATGLKKDLWEYDPSTNMWTQKASFGGTGRRSAVGFAIGQKGYIGTGDDGANRNDFWEYDPSTNAWTQKANFGGTPRSSAAGFAVNGKGYIGTGYDISLTNTNDFWEYAPLTNTWTQVASFGGTARANAVGFAIGTKGYLGTGYDGSVRSDFWEFSPTVSMDEKDEKQEVSIYPNPMHAYTTITLSQINTGSAYTFGIYNLQGKKVRESQISASQTIIERNGLPQGTYIYSISNGTRTVAAGKLLIVD